MHCCFLTVLVLLIREEIEISRYILLVILALVYVSHIYVATSGLLWWWWCRNCKNATAFIIHLVVFSVPY